MSAVHLCPVWILNVRGFELMKLAIMNVKASGLVWLIQRTVCSVNVMAKFLVTCQGSGRLLFILAFQKKKICW